MRNRRRCDDGRAARFGGGGIFRLRGLPAVVVVVLLSPDPTGNCRRPTTHSLPSTPSTHLSIYLGLPNTLDPAPCKVNVTPKGGGGTGAGRAGRGERWSKEGGEGGGREEGGFKREKER